MVYEYSYTGPSFTTVVSPYTTSNNVTGEFEVSSLLNNGLLQTITPLSYSFSDGQQTLTNLNSSALVIVSISNEKIVSWTVDVTTGTLSPLTGQVISTTFAALLGRGLDFGTQAYANPLSGSFGEVTTSNRLKGSWTVAAVPEPSTWALMLLGFAGLGFAGYRRGRAQRGLA